MDTTNSSWDFTLDAGTKVWKVGAGKNVETMLENSVRVRYLAMWKDGSFFEAEDGNKYFVVNVNWEN